MKKSVFKTVEFDKIREAVTSYAGSAMGKERCARMVPLSEPSMIREKLDETDEVMQILQSAEPLPLGGIRDIRSSVTRAGLGAVLMPDEFLAIRSTLYAARRLKRFFQETALELPRLRELAIGITMFQKIEDKIEGAISEQGAVRDDASVELMRIRRDLKSFQGQIKDRLEGILKHPDYQKFFQENLVRMRGDRYVIPVKQAYRHAFPGIVHDQSASGATVFIEPMAIVKINNDIKQLQLSEKQEVERILRVLSQLIGADSELIRETCEAMAELDFIVARALYSEAHQAVRPIISEQRCISLRKARHPLIDRTKVVPIDIVMKPNTKALLITGPNTGGKTVTMKTLGLFALMMQSGLFLPAAEASELPIFDSVYADIGDEQSIEQSLSTFSAHMTHLVDILRQAKPNDLLLLDEVGAGTDPEEGAALAMAILEHILSCGAKTVATTHYSQLKLFAYEHPEIENASVEFDTKTLRPTYRLLIGVPGSSNAFAISKRLGLSDDIISKAQEFLEEEHIRLESVLSDLEAEKRAYTERSEEAYRLQQESIRLKRRASDERRELKAEQKRILQKAQEEAAAIIQEARRQSEMVIRELKEQFKQTNEAKRQASIQSARTSLQRARDNVGSLDRYEEKGGMKKEEAKVGQTVYVASLRQKGTIESIKGDNAIVQCGFLKTTVPITSCSLVEDVREKKAEKPKKAARSLGFQKAMNVRREIDIRGMLVEEAESVLGKYLDDAVLAGLAQVIIIHGKGTGALRKGVQAYLKHHNSVFRFEPAPLNEGGDGATLVTLQ